MNSLCHVIVLSAAFCLLLALASGYPLQEPGNALTEDMMERRSAAQRFTVDELLNFLNERYQETPDKRQMRQTGLSAIDNVKGMYYNDKMNRVLAAIQRHMSRR